MPGGGAAVVERGVDAGAAIHDPGAAGRERAVELRDVGAHARGELRAVLVGDVHARGEAMREPRCGAMVDDHAPGVAVDVDRALRGGPHRLGWRGEEAARGAIEQTESAPESFIEHAGAIGARGQFGAADDDPLADVDVYGRMRREPEVAAGGDSLLAVGGLDTRVVGEGGARVIRHALGATAHVEPVLLHAPRREHRRAALALEGEQVGYHHLIGLGVAPVVVGEAPFGVHEPVETLPQRDAHRCARSGNSLLRDDLYDAAGCFGAIERRRGRTLDDLDALDGRGVDVVEPGNECAGAGAYGVVDAETVDVEKRFAGERETSRSAYPDARTGANDSRDVLELHARCARVEQLAEGAHRRFAHHRFGVDVLDHVADGALLDTGGRARHDGRIELERYRFDGEPHVLRADGGIGGEGAIADAGGAQTHRGAGEARDLEATGRIGARAELCSSDGDLDVAYRLAGGGIGHDTGDSAGLRCVLRHQSCGAEHRTAEDRDRDRDQPVARASCWPTCPSRFSLHHDAPPARWHSR